MQGEPPIKASTPTGAVFLSYASQDAGAAQRICQALRAAGIEVWFDQSELRGGDAWDRKIREKIHDCRLFIPVISANTERRDEGYFRREWALAEDRTRDMAYKRTFLVPLVIDGTSERGASVPEKFHEVQWTRVPGGETPAAFVERIRHLLAPDTPPAGPTGSAGEAGGPPTAPSVRGSPLPKPAIWIAAAIVALVCAYFVADKLWLSKYSFTHTPAAAPGAQQTAPSAGTEAAFNPPPHSIAVLPFVNMSGDKEQEYFSDGLTEELLNSLARINELQVAARTSAFSFKGKDTDIGTIARKLNVGAVLEGSVRRSAHTVRITTQLINAATGYHLWSETYDRDLGDVLKLQTEIATSVAEALKVTLLGTVAASTELGGTHNPAAFDAYLRGRSAVGNYHGDQDLLAAIAAYTEAIKLDPGYALAYAGRAVARHQHLDEFGTPAGADAVEADARRAIALAPNLAEGHLALAHYLDTFQQDLTLASAEYERAVALAPGNVQVMSGYALVLAYMGRADASLAAARRAVALDPLSSLTRRWLGRALYMARQYDQAITAMNETSRLDPGDPWAIGLRGLSYYLLGNGDRARASCEVPSEHYEVGVCRAIVYRYLGRPTEAAAQLKAVQVLGDQGAYQYAQIYAQWGDKERAIEWLDAAKRLHDTGLKQLKGDPLVDPLRGDARFRAIETALHYPN
jgi:TolB-like protein